jgi:hypothetical protein
MERPHSERTFDGLLDNIAARFDLNGCGFGARAIEMTLAKLALCAG